MADDLRNMTLDDEVAHYLEECKALDGVAVTPENKPRFRKLQEEELRIRKALDAAKAEEKRPHLDANAAIEARFKPKLTAISEAVKAVTAALTKFMLAEEARLRAEAEAKRKAAAEEAARAAALAHAAEVEADPFEAFDKAEAARGAQAEASSLAREAAEPVKVSVASFDGARAAGLRTVGWIVEVDDPTALVAHYAHRSEFLELAKKLAATDAKASKGQAKIPGVRLVADRRAA